MKTAYIITPGLQLPGDSFVWRGAPTIISQPMIWESMRGLGTGLIFRVRTDKNVGDHIDAADRIESAVGLIDTTSCWRACLAIIRSTLSALRIPDAAEGCWNVFGMMTGKHQASVAMSERQQLAAALRTVMDKLPQDDARAVFETGVCAMCVRLAFAENDIEIAHVVPYVTAYMINCPPEHAEDREATVEVMASQMILCEAYNRLSEKTPEWLFAPLPATPGASASGGTPPTTHEKPIKAQEKEPAEED